MILLKLSFDFSAINGFGLTVAVVGYCTVFCALVIMYYVFNTIPKLINLKIRQKLMREGKIKDAEDDLNMVGEENAAISMALYLYFDEQHDVESHKLTIKNVQKIYSPWSSKIYSLNEYFRKTS